jgi:hypothetical protein
MILMPAKIKNIYINIYLRRLTTLKKVVGILLVIILIFMSLLIFNISRNISREIYFLEISSIIICLVIFVSSMVLALNTLFKKSYGDIVASPRFQLIPSQSMLVSLLFGVILAIFSGLPIVIAFHSRQQAFGYGCLALLTILFVSTSIVLATYLLLFLITILIRKIHGKVSIKMLWKYFEIIFIAITVIATIVIVNSRNLGSAQMIQAYSLLPSSITAIAIYAEKTEQFLILLCITGTMLIISLALMAIFDFSSGWFLEAWQDIYEAQDK